MPLRVAMLRRQPAIDREPREARLRELGQRSHSPLMPASRTPAGAQTFRSSLPGGCTTGYFPQAPGFDTDATCPGPAFPGESEI